MRALLLSIMLAAIAAAVACGQTIDGPTEVKVGEATWYSITDVPAGSQAVWIPNSELQAGPPYIRDGHAQLIAKTPGKRSIVAIVAVLDSAGKLQGLVPMSKEVEVVGEAPQPDPFHNPYPVPSDRWKAAVTSILSTKPSRDYAVDRAARFHRFAQTVRAGTVTSVGELMELMAAEKAEGSWPATKTAVAGVLTANLGRSNVPLDAVETEAMLSAIAWAIMEASNR